MKNFEIKIPDVVLGDPFFDTFKDAYEAAQNAINTDRFKFVTIYHKGNFMRRIFKRWYFPISEIDFNECQKRNEIADFFILYEDGKRKLYAKKRFINYKTK